MAIIPVAAVARRALLGQRLRWSLAHSRALLRRDDEAVEERMRARGPALELRVELRADEPWMGLQLDDLDEVVVRRAPADDHARRLSALAIGVVELVAVAVALEDDWLAVRLRRLRSRRQAADPLAQAHRAAHVGDLALVRHQVNHFVLG